MSKTTISPSSSKSFWTAKTHLLVLFSHEHKKSKEHFIICVVSDGVYSLCHYRFNDLFINPVRGWIYLNKYTAAWQFCIWPRWIFHNIKQSGGEAEEGGARITRSHMEWRFTESLTHTNKRTSTADTSNRTFKETVHSLFIVVYELPLCPWFSLRPSCHLDAASALIIFRIFSFCFQCSHFISLLWHFIWLFLTHTVSHAASYKKRKETKEMTFIRNLPLLGFPLLFAAAPPVFVLLPLVFSLSPSMFLFLVITCVLQHWVIPSCAFSNCPPVESCLSANLTFLTKSLPHHLAGPSGKIGNLSLLFRKITFHVYQKHYSRIVMH